VTPVSVGFETLPAGKDLEMFDSKILEWLLVLVTAAVAGALIGGERETRGHPAGVRTQAIVALAAALLTRAGQTGFVGPGVDLSRVASQVVTGIGFDPHLDPSELMTGGDQYVMEVSEAVRKLARALEQKGEAGLRATPGMGRFDATLRAYCVGYIAGRRGQDDEDEGAGRSAELGQGGQGVQDDGVDRRRSAERPEQADQEQSPRNHPHLGPATRGDDACEREERMERALEDDFLAY